MGHCDDVGKWAKWIWPITLSGWQRLSRRGGKVVVGGGGKLYCVGAITAGDFHPGFALSPFNTVITVSR